MFINTLTTVEMTVKDTKEKKNFAWNDAKEKILIEIVSKHADAKTKKWHLIQQEFQTEIQYPVDISVVRNRWNLLTREYKQSKRIFNASGTGSANNEILPTAVLNEFSESPVILSQSFEQFQELSQILDRKIANGNDALHPKNMNEEQKTVQETPRKKKGEVKMNQFEQEIISLLKNDNGIAKDFLKESYEFLEELNLDDKTYFKAVDILSNENNAKTFMALPEK